MKELHIYSLTDCQPCQQLKRVLQEVELPVDRLRIYDVDLSKTEAAQAGVRSVPTCILVVNGEEVNRKVAITSKKALLDFVNQV